MMMVSMLTMIRMMMVTIEVMTVKVVVEMTKSNGKSMCFFKIKNLVHKIFFLDFEYKYKSVLMISLKPF